MTLVVKEIQINTVIEKKVVQTTDLSDSIYRKIEEEVARRVTQKLAGQQSPNLGRKKKER